MRNNINSVRVSLHSLLTDFGIDKVVVPIIQRDYAQGRKHESDVRNNFLQALLNYLVDPNQESHDLDFIYGNKNDDQEFIPLDGQQRLTTLFLLHYYLAIHDEMFSEFERIFIFKGKSRFSYETRSSASDFCNSLVTNPLPKTCLGRISDSLINEYAWFSQSWINDPTVSAMLNMLESIHYVFNSKEGLFSRLINKDRPAVTFRALFMQESGLNDDLYIKMNSRGLELSRFENLKARIIQKLKDENSKTYSLQRTKQKAAEEVSISDYFSFKVDINWSDLFWFYRKEFKRITDSGEEYTICEVDSSFINFITTIALNYNALHGIEVTNPQMTSYDKLGWSFYDQLPNDFFIELIDVFDIFEQGAIYDESSKVGICNRLTDEHIRFNIRKTFDNFVHKRYSDAAYAEHIQFYAYYAYLLCHKDSFEQNDFNDWMRIVMNLTNNHTWQNEQDFIRSMKTIKWLIDNNTSGIINLLGKNNEVKDSGFNPTQFKEERIKASLRLRNDANEWKSLIIDAEKHEYFKGQISWIINFSGIETYFDNNDQKCDWASEESLAYKDSFIRYTKAMEIIFNSDGLKTENEDKEIFRRALLCYGKFGKLYGGKRWSFLRNKHRDYSWKRFLLEEKTRKNLKDLIDNYDYSIDFIEYLKGIITKHKVSKPYCWNEILIINENIWNHFGEDYFLCFDNNENDVYVLGYKTMGGWHGEIRTLCLMYELKCYNYDVKYNWSESWEKFPSLSITHKTMPLNVEIKYRNNLWNFKVHCSDESQIQETLELKMRNLGFQKSEVDFIFRKNTPDSPIGLVGEIINNDL